jgi:hypothetical protein
VRAANLQDLRINTISSFDNMDDFDIGFIDNTKSQTKVSRNLRFGLADKKKPPEGRLSLNFDGRLLRDGNEIT